MDNVTVTVDLPDEPELDLVRVIFLVKYKYLGVVRLGVNFVQRDDLSALVTEGIVKEF